MYQIFIALSSENISQFKKIKKYRKIWMFIVFSIHIVGIIIIELYNIEYLIDLKTNIKKGPLGLIYQIVKVFVMLVDLSMIFLIWKTFNGLLLIRYKILRARLFKGLIKKLNHDYNRELIIKIWLVFLLTLNSVWIIIRAFVRNL